MTKIKGLKIVVIKGGWSSERKISLLSGKAIESALIQEGFAVIPFDLKRRDDLKKLWRIKFDLAFIALHGKYGEDGGIQAFLEGMGVPYTGSGILASALAMNKIFSKKIFEAEGISTPEYQVLTKGQCNLKLSLPVVVKPSQEGSTIGVSIVGRKKELTKALKLAFKYDHRILVEKYIEGKEISVGILGSRALPVIELRPKKKFYDYQAKYKAGMCEHIVPASIPKKTYRRAQELALKAHSALGCRDYSRVDMILGEKGVYVLEVNTLPGMTKLSLVPEAASVTGINFGKLVKKIVELALKH